MKVSSAPLLMIGALVLVGCEEDAAPEALPTETGGEAAGDVLEGTISDDMLPLDQLTSTSPLAEPTNGGQDIAPPTDAAIEPEPSPEQPAEPAPVEALEVVPPIEQSGAPE